MGNRKLIDSYYGDINNLADYLTKLVNSYRLMVASANDLNDIALARKGEVRKAIHLSNELGDVIDDVIQAIQKSSDGYFDYCKIKSGAVKNKVQPEYVETEIQEDLILDVQPQNGGNEE